MWGAKPDPELGSCSGCCPLYPRRGKFYRLKISWIRGNWPIRSWRDYWWRGFPRQLLFGLASWQQGLWPLGRVRDSSPLCTLWHWNRTSPLTRLGWNLIGNSSLSSPSGPWCSNCGCSVGRGRSTSGACNRRAGWLGDRFCRDTGCVSDPSSSALCRLSPRISWTTWTA